MSGMRKWEWNDNCILHRYPKYHSKTNSKEILKNLKKKKPEKGKNRTDSQHMLTKIRLHVLKQPPPYNIWFYFLFLRVHAKW